MSGRAGYLVHVAESVEVYIRGIYALSEMRRQEILNACHQDLSQGADHFLERFPLKHESYTFQYEYAFIDGDLVYSFRFIADGVKSPWFELTYPDVDDLDNPHLHVRASLGWRATPRQDRSSNTKTGARSRARSRNKATDSTVRKVAGSRLWLSRRTLPAGTAAPQNRLLKN